MPMILVRTLDLLLYSIYEKQPVFFIDSLFDNFLNLNGEPCILVFLHYSMVNLISIPIRYVLPNPNCNSFRGINEILFLMVLISS